MSVLATSVLITNSSEKIVRVPYIYYLIRFLESQGQEGQKQVRALLNSSSKVNAMNLAYIEKLGFKTQKTNIGAQKIDGSAFETFAMVIADFRVEDKVGRPRFFQKIL